MSSEDKSNPGNSRSDKFTGSPVAPAQAPSVSSGHVVSANLESNFTQIEEIILSIQDETIVGFCMSDLAGRITFVNNRYCEITGYSRDELLGIQWMEITHPDDRQNNIEYLNRMLQDGKTCSFEKRYLRKNGEIIWVNVGASQRRGAGGQGLGGAAFVVDVTERKAAEKALKESEKKYRLLFENSRDALMTTALPSWKFTSANQSTLQMFGAASEAEFIRLGPWDTSPERQPNGQPSAEKALQMLEAAMREGSNFFEWTHKRFDGRTFPAEVLLTRMEHDGQVFMLGSVRDISERKRLKKEIVEQRNEMAELQKLQFAAETAAAFAHELNQPLLAIASYSEAALMLLKAEKPDLGKVCKAIERSALQAHRAGKSIRELLGVLRMKEFSTETIDINQEIHTTLDIAKSEYELQFDSTFRTVEGIPLILANRAHLKRALLNLLHNGIEAAREAGMPPPSITLTLRTIMDENLIQLTIQDNGPGINKDAIQHLFEPFFTTKAKGIGMGLAISRTLIEANGGRLWVDLQQEPGATFHLTLPFAT